MFKKPNGKSIGSSASKVAAIVVGAKVSDGVAAILPESVASYKSWGLAAVGLVLAASVNPSTASGEFTQNALLGMAGKQLYNGVTEVLVPAVEQKDSTTTTGKFMNALIGHENLDVTTEELIKQARLGMTWEPAVQESAFDRPAAQKTFNVQVS